VYRYRGFNVLLILSILWVYQLNTLHFTHIFEEDDHCNICITQKSTSLSHNPISFLVDTYSLYNIIKEDRVVTKTAYKITQTITSNRVDFEGLRYFTIAPIPLGYFSHAPPHFS